MSMPLLYSRNVNQDLYVHALSSIYRAGWRIYDPDYALSREPDIWEEIRRDPIIAHAIEQRTHMVAGPKWTCQPGGDTPNDKHLADIVTEMVEGIDGFTEARYQAAQAVIIARQYHYIEGERKVASFAETPEMNFWCPTRLCQIDKRRFRLVPRPWRDTENKEHIAVSLEMFSEDRRNWEMVEHPEWFLKHKYGDEESRLFLGRGILEAIYFYHWMKGVVLREGLQGVERWAQGMAVVKIDGLRAGSEDRDTQTVLNTWLDVIKKQRARNSLVFDSKDEVEIINSDGTGHAMVMEFLQYLDNAITRLILGAVLPTGGDTGEGSFARAETEMESSQVLIEYDRRLLDETITRDLVALIVRQNKPQFAMLGLIAAKMPKFTTVAERRRDPQVSIAVISQAITSGIKLKKDEVYEAIGFSQPTDDDGEDDVIGSGERMPGPGEFPPGSGPGWGGKEEKGEEGEEPTAEKPEKPPSKLEAKLDALLSKMEAQEKPPLHIHMATNPETVKEALDKRIISSLRKWRKHGA